MGDVVDLDSQRPHLQGQARCGGCQHKWQAVVPVGTVTHLECPACHRTLGVMTQHVLRGDDDSWHWVCKCGCDMFHIHEQGTYCASCGSYKWEKT